MLCVCYVVLCCLCLCYLNIMEYIYLLKSLKDIGRIFSAFSMNFKIGTSFISKQN